MPTPEAYHEASHAVVAWRLRYPIDFVTIRPNAETGRDGLTYLGHPITYRGPDLFGVNATISAAGGIGQRMADPASVDRSRWRGDRAKVMAIAHVLRPGERARREFLRYAAAMARNILLVHWFAVDQVARTLMVRETVSGAQLIAIVDRAELEMNEVRCNEPGLDPVEYAARKATLSLSRDAA